MGEKGGEGGREGVSCERRIAALRRPRRSLPGTDQRRATRPAQATTNLEGLVPRGVVLLLDHLASVFESLAAVKKGDGL